MNRNKKLIEKFLDNPIALSYFDIEKILIQLGFNKLDGKGSHIKFKHFNLPNDLIFPIHNNDCKDFYKKQAFKELKKYNLI